VFVAGIETLVVPYKGSPAELQALLGSEIQRWGGVIRAAKIEPE
jgi:tripartite-type tricarboxylate transporter receptor subunit TctC